MNKVTTVNVWLNNFTDVGPCGGHFNFERQRKEESIRNYKKIIEELSA